MIDRGRRSVLGVLAQGARLNAFDVVTPDGQPVRWALNLVYGAALADRVYGPTLTMAVLRGCEAEGLPAYLYGSTRETLDRLVPALTTMFPRPEDRRRRAVEVPGGRTGRGSPDRRTYQPCPRSVRICELSGPGSLTID
jgi:hypothetical protein